MQYNIWLEVTSLLFNLIIWIFYRVQYKRKTRINILFQVLTFNIFFLTLTDILSAITISYYDKVMPWINYVFNGSNFIFAVTSAFCFTLYVRTFILGDEAKTPLFDNILIAAFIISELINPFSGIYFSFTDVGYIHGPLYILQMLIAYYFVIVTAYLLFKNYKLLTPRKIVGTGSYIVLMMIVGALQMFVVPHFLMTGLASTLTLLMIFLLMETPDYYKLLDTLKQLDEARNEANEANEIKSRFLANMSHEIRTPLNSILGINEMILRESDSENIIEYATDIKNSGSTLLGIINDILDYSKIESGNLAIISAPYSLPEVISIINTMMSVKAKEKALDFKLNVDATLPVSLDGDKLRISQIIINLINNAIKYTEKGSVSVSINRLKSTSPSEILLQIQVTDTGIGISEEDIGNLFQEFQRLEEKKNRNIEGTGLGLAITNRLTSQMGGEISVESVYGQGSTFTVKLPQTIVDASPMGEFSPEHPATKPAKYKPSLVAPNARILAVDDNKMNLLVLTKLLKQTQITIDTKLSGAEALEALENNAYDIVLLDHMMPQMDGIETLQRAKELEKTTGRKPVYIVLTANAIQGVEEEYLEKGFDYYLSKPINPEILEQTLIKYLPK